MTAVFIWQNLLVIYVLLGNKRRIYNYFTG